MLCVKVCLGIDFSTCRLQKKKRDEVYMVLINELVLVSLYFSKLLHTTKRSWPKSLAVNAT